MCWVELTALKKKERKKKLKLLQKTLNSKDKLKKEKQM